MSSQSKVQATGKVTLIAHDEVGVVGTITTVNDFREIITWKMC